MPVRKLTVTALFIALGTAAGVFSIPLAGARLFPVQHAINVLTAVSLGPFYAVVTAFGVAVLRNLLGTGTILAFPGGMVGAFLAGILFSLSKKEMAAALGEVIGTGLLGGLAAFPLARFVLGQEVLAFAYVIPFSLSSLAGAVLGYLLIRVLGIKPL